MQISENDTRFLEELAINALPALRTILYDGWLLRFADRYTGRANSVQPLYPGYLPLHEKISHCEEKYRAAGTKPNFKMTHAALPSGLDEELDARGYTVFSPVSVQTAPIPSITRIADGVKLEEHATDQWMDAFIRLKRLVSPHDVTFRRLLAITPPPTGFASRIEEGEIVAVGLGVVERGWVGLYDMVVAEEHRRRGHATGILQSLLAWARTHGAANAYLQVTKGNDAAHALYANSGFREAHKYWYRVKQP